MENKIIKAGTKVVLHMDAGMAGTGASEAYMLVRDYTEETLYEIAYHRGLDHAAMYGVYPECDKPEDWDEEDNYGEEYSDNIEGYWELYNEEKHEGKCSYDSKGVVFNKL